MKIFVVKIFCCARSPSLFHHLIKNKMDTFSEAAAEPNRSPGETAVLNHNSNASIVMPAVDEILSAEAETHKEDSTPRSPSSLKLEAGILAGDKVQVDEHLRTFLCEALMNKTLDASIKTKAVMMLTTTTFSSLSPIHQGLERGYGQQQGKIGKDVERSDLEDDALEEEHNKSPTGVAEEGTSPNKDEEETERFQGTIDMHAKLKEEETALVVEQEVMLETVAEAAVTLAVTEKPSENVAATKIIATALNQWDVGANAKDVKQSLVKAAVLSATLGTSKIVIQSNELMKDKGRVTIAHVFKAITADFTKQDTAFVMKMRRDGDLNNRMLYDMAKIIKDMQTIVATNMLTAMTMHTVPAVKEAGQALLIKSQKEDDFGDHPIQSTIAAIAAVFSPPTGQAYKTLADEYLKTLQKNLMDFKPPVYLDQTEAYTKVGAARQDAKDAGLQPLPMPPSPHEMTANLIQEGSVEPLEVAIAERIHTLLDQVNQGRGFLEDTFSATTAQLDIDVLKAAYAKTMAARNTPSAPKNKVLITSDGGSGGQTTEQRMQAEIDELKASLRNNNKKNDDRKNRLPADFYPKRNNEQDKIFKKCQTQKSCPNFALAMLLPGATAATADAACEANRKRLMDGGFAKKLECFHKTNGKHLDVRELDATSAANE
jgi:hypothetical protein